MAGFLKPKLFMLSRKILIVDDDYDDCELLKESLSTKGITECIIVQSAEDALKKLDELESLPDLIVLDLHMPKTGGVEFLTTLKNHSRFKDIDVIIYSSSVLTVHKKEVLAIGAKEFIQKPIEVKEFEEIVEKMLKS